MVWYSLVNLIMQKQRVMQVLACRQPPYWYLVTPRGGTPLMLAHPDLALDLPFRVLISQLPDGQVNVSYHPAEELQRYGLDATQYKR